MVNHYEKQTAKKEGSTDGRYRQDLNESQWYNCKNYRINFVSEGDCFYIRDIYKFDENYTESCYDTPCKEWSIAYDNLPVMEGHLWRKDDTNRAGIYFEGKYKKDGNMRCTKQDDSFVIEAELVEMDGFGHNDGIYEAYKNRDLIEWLISKRRTNFELVREAFSEAF